MSSIALVTAIAAAGQDDDLSPLLAACTAHGLRAEIRAWDDPSVAWTRYDAVLLRSPWDYTERLDEFLAWCERVDAASRLLNPWPVLRWNTDKHYLADLAARGVPVVPTASRLATRLSHWGTACSSRRRWASRRWPGPWDNSFSGCAQFSLRPARDVADFRAIPRQCLDCVPTLDCHHEFNRPGHRHRRRRTG
ncbi:hypothetical protein [Lysobacter capsici]|uniref:hypothetical protein n=1 Tax=Lysobacter capsici TaxID=435897 RepID=UPI001BFFF674|nr:hypothetical protein [Lysobacter capsici]QWF16134.1 hypothetical protein KME82_20595 [Lysobacter capsici]